MGGGYNGSSSYTKIFLKSQIEKLSTIWKPSRNAKGWLSKRMNPIQRCRKIADQPAFAAIFDPKSAYAHGGSFRKIVRGVEKT
uniref:Uncharacterized protein n=1 Tax=Candidatus Kentrum sp. TC TaxID=2126339 RepID=A0A450YRK2_9GAMM|nr:MAG: hypothetical protein BECKTC1821E_GA0114239_103223 [Candidatus Kentron sp. TC]VFK46567.1 MAG: hypothetical protein BECKTC1821D_GA0114238_103310 [Candidatus Kentron sp. TC]VFK59391.1 MAG: hypothetical protein BECKTC1821F_GA0114240_10338 [Candidatus Kentron sp. TC]